jgi:hypothetical protein
MFLKEFTEQSRHTRTSKLGSKHSYTRTRTYCVFRCDNCDSEFTRERGKMDPKRLSNNYFHVCNNCDGKRFAQKRGVERRKVWELSASSRLPISKL